MGKKEEGRRGRRTTAAGAAEGVATPGRAAGGALGAVAALSAAEGVTAAEGVDGRDGREEDGGGSEELHIGRVDEGRWYFAM